MSESSNLLSESMLSKRRLNFCHADPSLQKKILQQLLQDREEHLNPFVVIIESE
jgi:hypothetical protein